MVTIPYFIFHMFIQINTLCTKDRPIGAGEKNYRYVCSPCPSPTLFFRRRGRTDTAGSITIRIRSCAHMQNIFIHIYKLQQRRTKTEKRENIAIGKINCKAKTNKPLILDKRTEGWHTVILIFFTN
jgi:hypothetical protein